MRHITKYTILTVKYGRRMNKSASNSSQHISYVSRVGRKTIMSTSSVDSWKTASLPKEYFCGQNIEEGARGYHQAFVFFTVRKCHLQNQVFS